MSRRATLGLAATFAFLASATVAEATGPIGQLFVPVSGCRALDTRLPAAPLGGPPLGPSEARTLLLTGTCGVPSNALSLAVNLTAVNPSATGFAVLYAGDAPFPATSNLSFSAHKTRAAFSIVSLATDGSGTLVLANGSAGTADFLLDVEGYFVRACTSAITVTNPATATGTVGAPFSQTFAGSGGVGGLTFSTASPLPPGLSLSGAGVLSGTPTQPGSFDLVVTATDANGCTGTGATYTLVIGCQTIAVTNPATTTGTANAPFSQTFTQSGGSGTTTFSTTDPLPIGLTLAANGVLSGTPTQAGSFNIKVKATDANGCTGTGATYPLVINCQTITVTNPATTTGTAGAAFSQTFTQAGAIGTATFTTASTLPTGLTLAANGVLSGTPTQVGTFPIVVTVKDSNLCGGAGATYNLTINCQTIAVTNPAVSSATAGTAFSQTFAQTGAIGSATFTTASTLPAGLTLAANGLLSGTPTQTGSFPIVVTVTDANGCTGAGATYTLVVGCQTYGVLPAAIPQGTSGVAYAGVTFSAPGGIGSVSFAESGALPSGMSFAAGVLSGTPTQTGVFPITVTATDGNGCAASRDYLLVVTCVGTTITLAPGALGTVAANVAFPTTQFTASGGTGPYTFQKVGALPPGMTFVTDTLSGTPTQTGTFPFTLVATDAAGCAGSQDYVVTVTCVGTTITVSPSSLPSGTAGTAYAGATFSASGGTGPYTLVETGVLPAGMTFAGGVLSGTPTGAGTFPITVTATDANGCSGQTSYSLVVACQPISVANPGVTTATEGNAFDQAFTATGILGTATWSTASALPSGLTLNPSTGHLSGTPTQTGSFDIVVKATDTNGCSGTGATYTLVITCPTITVSGTLPASLTYATAWAGATFTQSGTSSTVTWSATGLPGGVTINPSTGAVTGAPTQTGTFSATITATDAGGCAGSKSVAVTVAPTAASQSYTGVGNTQMYVVGIASPPGNAVPVAASLLTGAQPAGGVTVTAASCSVGGAITTFDSAGRFVFTPDVSATSATCTYTIASNTGGTATPATATASLGFTLTGRVWWVDNQTLSGTNDGRSNTPFKTMTAVGSAATANNDFIYVRHGSGATSGSYAMKPGQSLIGAGADLKVPTASPILTIVGATVNTPNLTGTITLANSVVVDGIDVTAGTNRAITNFNGSSYSTVTGVSVKARWVTTTTGAAIDVQGTGNTGTMTFEAVTANGGTNGIVLSNFTGGFTVTGAGGACNPGDTTCSGGSIRNMTGADSSAAVPPGTGVVLNNVSNVSLSNMRISSNSNYDIRGTSVSNLTIAKCLLDGTTGTNGTTPYNDGAASFDNLTGTVSVSDTNVQGGLYNNFRVVNTAGTLGITFTNVTFDVGTNTAYPTNDALTIESQNAAVANVTVQNSFFKSAAGDLFQLNDNGTGADSLTFTGNTLTNANSAIATGGGGVTIGSNGAGNITSNFSNNTLRDSVGHAILFFKSTGAATVTGTFDGNVIGVSGLANTGSAEGDGIKVQNAGQGTVKVTITNNQIRQYNNFGIELLTGGGASAQSGNLNATITGNTIAQPGNTASTIGLPKNGIHVNDGTVPGDTYTVCADIGGAGALANAMTGSGAESVPPSGLGAIDFRLRQRQNTTLRLPNYAGANNDNAAVVTFVSGNNGGASGLASNTVGSGGFGFTGGPGSCP